MNNVKNPKVLLGTATALLVIIVAVVLWGDPVWQLLSDQTRLQTLIRDAGPLGPLVLAALQFLQTLVAPLPGGVLSFAGGYLFGTILGTIYTMTGLMLGTALIFVLSRRFGRPLVERFVDRKTLDKFDYLAKDKGLFIIFLIFLMPFFPDDLICYIVGLTKIPIKNLLIVTFLARLPVNTILAFAGDGVADANTELAIYVVIVGLTASILAWWQRDNLEKIVKRLSKQNVKSKK